MKTPTADFRGRADCPQTAGDGASGTMLPAATKRRGFSLVEVLAAIAIIGIITFLAIPNLLRIKEDSERNLAMSRAETLNMAMASLLQAGGEANATAEWSAAANNDARYALLTRYVAFATADVDDYMPSGYAVTLPTNLTPLTKVALTGPAGAIPY